MGNNQTIAERLGATYVEVGDYLLPNIALNDPPDTEPLTKYGMMRKSFLKTNKPALYGKMLCHEELYPHCREVERQAHSRIDALMEHLVVNNPPPDKVIDGIAWAAHMQMLHHTAEEIVLSELIYSQM